MHLHHLCEYNADTTNLVQLLRKGHHGVQLDREGWDRLITWIDLHTPAHGTWHEIVGMNRVQHLRDRRRDIYARYAGRDEDPEAIIATSYKPQAAGLKPQAASSEPRDASHEPAVTPPPGWPFDAAEAQRRQGPKEQAQRTLDLGDGIKLDLVRIPAGEFIMGDPTGAADERPACRVAIGDPFWIGKFEITNEQFARFDSGHDSRLETGDFLQFSEQERGYSVNAPRQPVCRVSWHEAMAFCRWLSEKTGEALTLPTEAQWEWACRAGSASAMNYGDLKADFGKLANLADLSLRRVYTYGWGLPSGAVPPWRPAIETVNDGQRVSAPVGTYAPNAWGLHDLHGNVAEWTLSEYRPYPYSDGDGAEERTGRGSGVGGWNKTHDSERVLFNPSTLDPRPSPLSPCPSSLTTRRVVRGGSWYDRPLHARSAYRRDYPAWQGVYDVGFRVIATPRVKVTQR